MRLPIRLFLSLALLAGASGAWGQALIFPLQINQSATFWNYQSQRGVPISSVTNVPPGSDGRMTNHNESAGSVNLPTANQFQGFLSFGGLPGLRSNDWTRLNDYPDLVAGTNPFSATVAAEMKLPLGRATSGDDSSPVVMILRRAQVGALLLSRAPSFAFGSEIAAPSTDEHGRLLTNVLNTAYWLPKPYFTSNLTDTAQGSYWSPNAQKVFAIRSGPISVTWIKADGYSSASPPAYTNLNGTVNFWTNGGSVYALYTAKYLVSGSTVKPPQKMYWTETPFNSIGHLVAVPAANVQTVNVVYNDTFPQSTPDPYIDPYSPPLTNGLIEYRTLWFEPNTKTIHAFNTEGRVFMELLGASQGSAREFLGFEIVDVYKEPQPSDVTVELGERVPAYADGRDDSSLFPSAVLGTDQKFYYRQTTSPETPSTFYATFKTANLNDFQSYWLINGVGGLQWPYLFNRYHAVWPNDPEKYVNYLRPVASTPAEAAATSVQLPGTEAPALTYQDPFPSPLGAFLATDGKFYTYLDRAHPAHRTLLKFTVGNQVEFERVFSWLVEGIQTNSLLAGSVATDLTAWNPTNQTLNFVNPANTPYQLSTSAIVGERIQPPLGELGSTGSYWAGYIVQTNGDEFNPGAYLDPFAVGFNQANLGAIIPVNARPGHDTLEVLWFRKNSPNVTLGFQPSHWPAVLGHYQLQWPAGADEIILASNDGSGGLNFLQANGSIYRQNDPAQPGYNPNEEHALILGGRAFALRDDLNITNGPGYSSAPFVLLDYTEADGRPAMHVFRVRREKPEAGIVFDYVVDAGSILQPPMPLPLLQPPTVGFGQYAVNFNSEPPANSEDLPVGWNSSYETSQFGHYARFTYEDRKHNFWVYRGQHAGLPELAAGQYNPANHTFNPLPNARAVVGQPFSYYIHLSRRVESITATTSNLPGGLGLQISDRIAISGIPTTAGSGVVTVTLHDAADDSVVTTAFGLNVVTNPVAILAQGPLALISSNQYSGTVVTFSNRAPYLAGSASASNSFTMRFYYKTEPSFDWPGAASPPAIGSIVPYLRPTSGGGFVGDASSSNTPSLDIVYRPTWPSLVNGQPLPTLFSGETLTAVKRGLAAVRGQSSAELLYQQSIGLDLTDAPPTTVLYDPTVQKTSSLTAHGLSRLPASVINRPYVGKFYFPNLPPNLADRVFYDPNTDNLVLQGTFKDETVGEKYVLLNVLAGADLAAVKGLCPSGDILNKDNWDAMVEALATPVYTFHEDPNIPGSYVNDPDATVTRGVGEVVAVTHSDTQVDSYALSATGPGIGYVTYIVGNGHDPNHASEPVSMYVLRVSPELSQGELKILTDANPLSEQISFQHTEDLAGRAADYEYDWRIAPPVDGQPPTSDPGTWTILTSGTDLTHFTLGGSVGIQALIDNYVTVRYRSIHPMANPVSTNWSQWTGYPDHYALASGWIKRVVAGVNPFNQRISDLFNNPANTTASIIAQAGHRWEGDVALNQDELNNYGLIEIYETVLNRGRALSVDGPGGGINFGPANDALLLASGYLNDLYMMLGNEAFADAANPTIGIGSANATYGNIATALFAFKGQEPSLLAEEAALLRGRDDFLAPGVRLKPAYNRLYWNYTLGIDAGEVIYALNYNILDQNFDGTVNATDAAILYPQAHGDAYGHYLTALHHYYGLLLNPNFDWVPRIETVSVLGAPVSVDFQDERKFAAAAAALARTGRQVFDLAWRQDYHPAPDAGWNYFGNSRANNLTTYTNAGQAKPVARYWSMDHWAARTGQGAYLNWVVGNAILPPTDPNPAHEGIQKVDRTTVPELTELPTTATELQADMDKAEGGFTPLGLPRNGIPFDINPLQVTGTNPKTHFEQIYERAVSTLNNAVVAFDDAQNVTQLMRSEEDSLANYQGSYTNQETAYNNRLIELYGTPYPDDIGPGKTYVQGYNGPDLFHYTYVENPDTNDYSGVIPDPTTTQTFYVDIQNVPANWLAEMLTSINIVPSTDPDYTSSAYSFQYNIGPNGFFDKPGNWTSQRLSPGRIQQAISQLIAARNRLRKVVAFETYDKQALDKTLLAFKSQYLFESNSVSVQNADANLQVVINNLQQGYDITDRSLSFVQDALGDVITLLGLAPSENIFGLAVGGDQGKIGVSVAAGIVTVAKNAVAAANLAYFIANTTQVTGYQNKILADQQLLNNMQLDQDLKNSILELGNQVLNLQGELFTINEALRELDDAERAYRALLAEGNRLQTERLVFRQRASAVIQGYRTRDAAFRIFRNEKLERYKTLFDLAAEYAFLAAQAYDYETGLLNTQQGQAFLNRIISARALGIVQNGQPQYAGSATGDPGLSSALAEMKAEWDVLKSRLGFNNPDGYGTTASLRRENYRILNGSDGDGNWRDVLARGRTDNLLADSDVKRYCQQIDDGTGRPVPGIVLTFSTTISDGLNLFGNPLAPGDHNYSPSSFATKIFAVGVDLDGYIGMDNPTTGTSSGGSSPPDPTLDPDALAATPYVYLIPVGADAMRSPPLGDTSAIRTWNVDDLTIPLPFNISASDFSSTPFYTAFNSLSEPLLNVRKNQAFRPVSTTDAFTTTIYGGSGALQPSQYTNQRLIGRSVWNSQWKLVIPGKTLLADPNDGLNRFIRSVKDVKLYFITYSYAGN